MDGFTSTVTPLQPYWGNTSTLGSHDPVFGSNETKMQYFPMETMSHRAHRVLSKPPAVLALVLGILAIVANALSLLSISQIRMRLTGHLRLIISLAISDILIGVSVILFIINRIVNVSMPIGLGSRLYRRNYWCAFVFIKALNTTALNSTLLNLIGMAADHYLAILKPLHHPTLMNKQRTLFMLLALWLMALLGGFSDYIYVLPNFQRVAENYTFCEVVYLSPYQEEYITFAIAILGFFQMLFCYVRIYVRIKQRQRLITNGSDSGVHYQLKYNARSLITTLLIVGTFVICWLPMCLFQIALIIKVKLDPSSVHGLLSILLEADQYLYDLHLLNAICDPIIYAVRMAEVQLGYRRLLWRICHFKSRMGTRSCDSIVHSTRLLEPKLSLLTSISRMTTQASLKRDLKLANQGHQAASRDQQDVPETSDALMNDYEPNIGEISVF